MDWIINGSSFSRGVSPPRSFFIEEFSPQMLRALDSCVNDAINMGQALIPVKIQSPGGDAFVLNGAISAFERAKANGVQVATVITGMAQSAGALIFMMGSPKMRFVAETGQLMVHAPSLRDAGGRLEEVKSLVGALERTEKPLLEKISKNLGKPKGWLEKKINSQKGVDWYLNAEEALKEGIATAIYSPTFCLELQPHFSII